MLVLVRLHLELDLVRTTSRCGARGCRIVLSKEGRCENRQENGCDYGFHHAAMAWLEANWFPKIPFQLIMWSWRGGKAH